LRTASGPRRGKRKSLFFIVTPPFQGFFGIYRDSFRRILPRTDGFSPARAGILNSRNRAMAPGIRTKNPESSSLREKEGTREERTLL